MKSSSQRSIAEHLAAITVQVIFLSGPFYKSLVDASTTSHHTNKIDFSG